MNNKNVLITGGTGSLGRGLIARLLKTEVAQIRIMARSEVQMVGLQAYYQDHKRVQIIIGDIRDRHRVLEVTRGCDIIFHLAALKHVGICEAMPTEAIQTNVIGTQNIIDCANSNQVSKVIYVSTDKAVKPNCTYGASKLLGEKVVLAANQVAHTKCSVFRCGNLFASSGSVIPLFKEQIRTLGGVRLTHREMNRLFISVPEAADMLVEVAERSDGGEIFVPRMQALKIYDIARYLLEQQGYDTSHIVEVGMREGEKLSEDMVTDEESRHVYKLQGKLSVIVTDREHAWVRNRFITPDLDYPVCSKEAVLPYEKVGVFIEQMQEVSDAR